MRKIVIIISFMLRWSLPAEAQEMQGMINSNYAGVNGIAWNPSAMADSKLYLDINVLATNVFYQADLGNNAYANFRLNGPSVMLNKGPHAFAIFDAARTAVSYRKIDITNTSGRDYNAYKVAGLAWGEFGVSYAYQFKRFERNVWSGGITLKALGGAGGAYFANTGSSIDFSGAMANSLSNIGGGMGAGKGFGMDIGVTYEKKVRPVNLLTFQKLCQQKFQDYVYKVGISLIDIGNIRFTKNMSGTHFNQNITGSLHGIIDSSTYDMVTDTNLQNYASSLSKDKFSMNLPTAVCIQFDYHYYKNWYFNGTFVQGLNITNNFVRRPTMIAFTPRFEKRWLEVNMPLSVSDMKYWRLGLSLRLWNFTIGSDNLLGSMGVGSKAGFDIYTSIKINFAKGRCGRKHSVSFFDPFKALAS